MKTLLFILCTFIFQNVYAFTLSSSTDPNLKGWADSTVEFLVNDDNCPAGVDVVGIIRDAVEVWNNVPTSKIKASYGGTTTSTTFSNPTTVYCEVNFNTVTNASEDYVPGAANSTKSNSYIVGGILYLNASVGQANIANFDRTALTIILAHEIGHILGLGHSSDTQALMYYDGTAKKKLSLGQDDIDGISYLYPSDELKDGKYAGCGIIKNLPPTSKRDFILLFLALLMPIAVWVQLINRKPILNKNYSTIASTSTSN